MIKEAYVSFEVAKLLKEKGFNDEVRAYYLLDNETKEDELIHDDRLDTPNQWSGDYYSAPTHQMAMAWLREKQIYIRIIEDAFGKSYCFEVYPKNPNVKINYYVSNYYKDTYEDAVETALKYCLKNLI